MPAIAAMTCSIMSTPASPHRNTVRKGLSARLAMAAGIRGQPGKSPRTKTIPDCGGAGRNSTRTLRPLQ